MSATSWSINPVQKPKRKQTRRPTFGHSEPSYDAANVCIPVGYATCNKMANLQFYGCNLREWAKNLSHEVSDTRPTRTITLCYEASPLFRSDASSGGSLVKRIDFFGADMAWGICYCQTPCSLVSKRQCKERSGEPRGLLVAEDIIDAFPNVDLSECCVMSSLQGDVRPPSSITASVPGQPQCKSNTRSEDHCPSSA